MNTELALPKIDVTPKPTKAQMIEALVERERELWKEKREEIDKKIELLNEEIKTEGFFLMSKADKGDFEFSKHTYCKEPFVRVIVPINSPTMKRLLLKHKALSNSFPGYFDDVEARKKIRAALSSPKKENPLLNNPDVKQALDSILSQISNKPLAIEAQEVEIVTDK